MQRRITRYNYFPANISLQYHTRTVADVPSAGDRRTRSTPMPGTLLDNRTRTFLTSEASRIGFVGEHHQRYSIVEESGSIEEWLVQVATFEVCDGTAEVYELPAHAVETLGLDELACMPLPGVADGAGAVDDETRGPDATPESMVESGTLFAVEYRSQETADALSAPAETTLLFDHQCSADEVESAFRLQSIEHRLRFGPFSPEYTCRHCAETVHWLAVPREAPVDSLSLAQRQRLLEDQSCGCEAVEG